jgi:collagenase-like PrtC family protease
LNSLRRSLREQNAEYKVVKNNLFKRALKDAGYEGLDPYVKGPVGVAFADEEIGDVAKVLKNFKKEQVNFSFTAGMIDSVVFDAEQIAKIAKVVNVECFCHGAMCVAVSGRCFMSQHATGLSANRGKCAQLCRRAWHVRDDFGNELKVENSRIMSAKDLCALPFIGKMKETGVMSFKIEGRNRSPEYVSTVVREYRKAIDNNLTREAIVTGIENLKKDYNRGFSSGFFLSVPTADDFSFSEHGEQEEKKEFVGKMLKVCKVERIGG